MDVKDFGIGAQILHDIDISKHNIPIGKPDMLSKALIIKPDKTFTIAESMCTKYITPCQKLQKINKIYEEILTFKTELINPATDFGRIKSMVDRGWTIYTNNIQITKILTDKPPNISEDELDKCIICLDEFTKTKYQIKMTCCSALYNPNCYIKCLSTMNKCPQCRKEWYITDDEKNMLKKLSNSTKPKIDI
jgi:hypothetical protein